MKRIPLLLCITMLLFCSCGFFGDQKYDCNLDDVESIQIVRLDEYIQEEYRYEYTILSQISDCKTFVSRLNELEHRVNWGEPSVMEIQYVVIKIDYRNGDFDLIHPSAQLLNRSGVNQAGYFFFDNEQFNLLISDYMKNSK